MTSLEANLRAVRARIDAAARAAGRDRSAVALLAVSKTWPADAVRALAALGQVDVGENRAQELIAKAGELAGLPVRWHFIGQLQRNKAAAIARLGAVVHSVDRPALVGVLDRVGTEVGRPVEVFVQVDLGGPGGDRPAGTAARGGATPDDVPGLADAVAAAAGLRLRGLMAVAPRDADPGPAFDRLAGLAARVRADHPEAVDLSAGMSGDLEAAVASGATIVRVGTALFGQRPLPCGNERVTPVTRAPRAPE